MLRSLKALEKCAIGATDGDIGQVKDLYFDDDAWAVRYLIVDDWILAFRPQGAGSWLPDLTAAALAADPGLTGYEGRVSDSGEGRWAVQAAIDEAVPVPVLSAALYARFSSRGEADFANRVQSAMRHEFGGHVEKPVPGPPAGT